MPKGWGWWALGAVACILLGVMWAAAGNPAAYPGLRATISNLVEWLETHDGAITALATIAIAAFTYTLYRSTEKLWKAGEQQIALAQTSAETTRRVLDHTRTVERAYVKISHVEPGLVFATDGTVRVTVQVKNFGRTPANVTDLILTPFVVRPRMALPEKPIYEVTQGYPSARAFLVANDRIFTHAAFPLPEFQQVLLGQLTLYLLGYVDYVDTFGQRHRGGYARLFVADQKENNLVFITNASYNYDVPRQPGEGRDWGENLA